MDQARAFIAKVETAYRQDARSASGKRLTRLHVHIAAKLAFWRSRHPSHRQIARAARCSARTVRRALSLLHDLGLLSWSRRVVALRGFRAQIANSYLFLSPLSISYQCLKSDAVLSASSPMDHSSALAKVRDAMQKRLIGGIKPVFSHQIV